MAQSLYRTYRPSTFEAVVNQNHVKTTLQNEIASGKFAHAYVFSGPRGVGKTTIARLFAKAINKEALDKHGLHDSMLIDIVEIDAASNTGVDHVREHVIQNAYAAPTQLAYKVFIIDEVHMLSASAFNALLKILEEPPQHVVFILATTEVHKIPATVLSRCQRFDFHTIKLPDIVGRLQWICEQEGVEVPVTVLERIARRAEGAIRDAESLLGQVLSLGEKSITDEQVDLILPRSDMELVIKLFTHLVNKDTGQYLSAIQQAVQDGMHLVELHRSMMEVLRQVLLYSVDYSLEHFSAIDVHPDVHASLVELMKRMSVEDCTRLIDLFMKAGEQLSRARIQQLPLETAGIQWCTQLSAHASSTPPTPTPAPVASQPTSTSTPASAPKNTTKNTITVNKTSSQDAQPVQTRQQHVAEVLNTSPTASTNSTKNLSNSSIDQAGTVAVAEKWSDIVSQSRQHNHSLAMSLSMTTVIGLTESNELQLGTKYEFHKERLHEDANIKIIQNVVEEVTGEKVKKVYCQVGDKYDIDMKVLNSMPSDNIAEVREVDNVWDLALETLQGEEVK